MKQNYRTEEKENCLTIAFEGDITYKENEETKEDLQKKISGLAEGTTDIIVDLDKVSYIDSSGLGFLVYLDRVASDNTKTLYIKNLNKTVVEILEVTGLDSEFNFME